jgi:hypothetical protein
MSPSFNHDAVYDGTYSAHPDQLVIRGNTLTVHLGGDDLFTADDLAMMAGYIAAHEYAGTLDVNQSLAMCGLPAKVDVSHPGLVTGGRSAQVSITAGDFTPRPVPVILNTGRFPRLPATTAERQASAAAIRNMFPGLIGPAEALILVRKAARVLSVVGCRSRAELEARAGEFHNHFVPSLSREQVLDALLFLIFRKVPADSRDRQRLMQEFSVLVDEPQEENHGMVSGSTGPFGRCVTNPIPVAGIVSEGDYLRRLRTPDGQRLHWQRTGSRYEGNGPVDCFELSDIQGRPLGELFLSPHHHHTSDLTPEGFSLEEI